MSDTNEASFSERWAKRDPDKLSTFLGGKRTPLQLIIANSIEDAMKCATVLGAPMADSLESLFNAKGVKLLPPHGQQRTGYEERLTMITDLLSAGQSGVYVAAPDRQSGESISALAARYNWPEKLFFLTDEMWICENGIAAPTRARDGDRVAFDYSQAILNEGSGHAAMPE
ncbi:hypothetical protein [Xanthomonas phage RTH11]|nr:hypothetical protein [Xanthomonas phage RTH11]